MKLVLDHITIHINDKLVCKDLSLTISPGEIWAILGPNGIGKTTFLKTLMGLHKLTTGEIYLDEKPLKSLKKKTIAQRMGFLLQDQAYTFPSTVTETISHGAYARNLKVTAMATHIKNILDQLQLSTLAQKSILELSGGEKRLIDFATILLQAPEFYLLDEPTNHLDLKYQQRLLTIARQLAHQRKSIIMSTHDINLASQYADHILMFFGNGLASHGCRSDLLKQDNLEALYQCRIQQINHDAKSYWLAESIL